MPMIRSPRTLALTLVLSGGLLTGAAGAGDLPGGYSCSDLRSTVATYGAAIVLVAARDRGLTERQIVSIRQRCGV